MVRTLYWYDDDAISEICKVMRCGGVVAGSSDTVFGLLASIDDEGRARLDEIKGRQDKPYILLVASIEQAKKYVDEACLLQIENFLKKYWPGPLTVIFRAKKGAPACLLSPEGTVAIRVPKHEGLQKLLACTGPLFSTSANRAGEPVPESIDDLDPAILEKVGAVVLDRTLKKRSSLPVPSTIIDASGAEIKVVREGAFSKKDLTSLLGAGIDRR